MKRVRIVPLYIALGLVLATFMAVPAFADPVPQTTPMPADTKESQGEVDLPDV